MNNLARKVKSILNLSTNNEDLLENLHQKLLDAKQIKDAQNFTHLFMFALWGIITGIAILCAPIPAIFVLLPMSFLLVFGVLVSAIISHQDNSDAYDEIDTSLSKVISANQSDNKIDIERQKAITYLQEIYVNNSNFIVDRMKKEGKVTPLTSDGLNDNEKVITNSMSI